ncbi:hypothetical protein [Cytophaga aurantiaca]|uniref:hypothetical protein n=1 Tax=Cytophaga aurantiaca TaxID=29530 RepID=UPI00035DC585|nr:hypothetical protein [Cytophaga aurantiaca]
MKKYIAYFSACLLLSSCGSSTLPAADILKHNYHLSNDSIEQSLEVFSLGDSTAQFVLRVENKYHDTLDSYMSHAASADGKHFTHVRENCKIAFEIKDEKRDTILLTQCDCPELSVAPVKRSMTTDSAQIVVFR